MNPGELSKELADRRQRAQDIVLRIQKKGFEIELSKVLANFDVFNRWALGQMSTGYLLKMVHLKPVAMPAEAYDALQALKKSLERNQCECLEVRKAIEMIKPLAEHIRSIQCEACSKYLFIRDEIAAQNNRKAG